MTTRRVRIRIKEGGNRLKAGQKGSVLVEAVLSLMLVILPLLAFHIELLRLAQYHALFHKMAFQYVRLLGLGESESEAKAVAFRLPRTAFREREAIHIVRYADFTPEEKTRGIEGRVRYRYSGFFTFWKPRIQLTKSCQFFLSR